jgi:hypothetical protein
MRECRNLLLAARRGAEEVAVRIALGAAPRVIRRCWWRARLAPGGVFGWASSVFASSTWRSPTSGSLLDQVHDGRHVFGFSSPFSRLESFSASSALQVSKTNLNEILKESGRGNAGGRRARWMASRRCGRAALTIVLLAGAGS